MAQVQKGTSEHPWVLKTPPLTSEFTMHKATIDGVDVLVCTVAKRFCIMTSVVSLTSRPC